ncbi:SAM-dependent methyltransferase TehB [Streptococcus sp. 20-1249]|uniref:SAM-dependent methyltransferase TehB n=1 Tax=Streptococcus hepaticus TaxID=3349163 RepID=UPI0037485ADD
MLELVAYKRMPVWTKETVPTEITHKHNTQVGTWEKIKVLKGQIKFEALSDEGEATDTFVFDRRLDIPMVEPQAWHRVIPLTDDTEFFMEFFCQPEDYFAKKYNYGRTHSEVIEAMEVVKALGKVLDLGCGQGRNALYLAKKGFDVTAVDRNEVSLEMLANVLDAEDMDMNFGLYDINAANLRQTYDFILSTVVFMFLNPEAVPAIIKNMQESTAVGGYNLIVCAMDTEDAPCTMNFPFTFKAGELRNYYKDWEFIKYNEDFGHLHKLDENGNPIRLRFATMLAKKVQ